MRPWPIFCRSRYSPRFIRVRRFYSDFREVWLANCYFAHNSLRFSALLPFFNASSGRPFHPIVRQIVVHHIKRISFSSAYALRFGIAVNRRPVRNARRKCEPCLGRVQEKSLVFRTIALESTLPPHNDGAARRASERIES